LEELGGVVCFVLGPSMGGWGMVLALLRVDVEVHSIWFC
jgi:hypothetical protein